MMRPDTTKYDAVGYARVGCVTMVVFECRCCGNVRDFGITKEEWLAVGADPSPPLRPTSQQTTETK